MTLGLGAAFNFASFSGETALLRPVGSWLATTKVLARKNSEAIAENVKWTVVWSLSVRSVGKKQ